MPARVSEAIVLRTYPLGESDLIVSFLARDLGKLRGVAKRARRPKSKFGAGLERLSRVQMHYFQRENRELASLDSCELVDSPFHLLSDYAASVMLDYLTEVSEQLLPPAESNEKFFRLLSSVLAYLQDHGVAGVWRVVTYFSLWAVRLAGFLPDLHVCMGCGTWLDDPESPERSFYSRADAGLTCQHCRRPNTWELSLESRVRVQEMLKKPIEQITGDAGHEWTRETAADLRRYLIQRIEESIERKLLTAPVLEAC